MIPHFAITSDNKSGKARFVLDETAKAKNSNLNKFLLNGPDIFNSNRNSIKI